MPPFALISSDNLTRAGGKGGPERTFAIDRDAAKAYIEAASTTKSVKKFLMVSYNGSRRNKPSWWSDEEWKKYQEVNQGALKNYYIAKVEADEALQAWSKKRQRNDPAFQAINLRPGTLTDEKGTGRISLGKIHALSKISRADVADVAVRLLERDDTSGYFDLLQGEEATPDAIDRVVSEKIDAFEGEDAHRIYGLVA
jgi:nucleoside-diphosphate-sugar epimerase